MHDVTYLASLSVAICSIMACKSVNKTSVGGHSEPEQGSHGNYFCSRIADCNGMYLLAF